jgi:hypothetical protein
MKPEKTEKLLALFKGDKIPLAEDFKELVISLDNHQLLAKVFLLEGTPFVFKDSPMKYTVFREQVGDQFGIGSQDVCIVGSARLGFSPSPTKFGQAFAETSDVDVVIVSFELFDRGSRELFAYLNTFGPQIHEVRPFVETNGKVKAKGTPPTVDLKQWKTIKDGVRNYTYQNLNPANLPNEHPLRREIFEKISSTSGIFCALEPQVFVSKIRARIFRNWKAAEDYYTNTLRELKRVLKDAAPAEHEDEEEADEEKTAEPKKE